MGARIHVTVTAPSVMLAVFITGAVVNVASAVGETRPAFVVEWALPLTALVFTGIPALLGAAIGFALGKEANRG